MLTYMNCSKRRIRHRPRLALARKRRRPHHRRLGPHPRQSLLHDPLLVRLHMRPSLRLARRRPAPPANGRQQRRPEPDRIRRDH